MLEDIIQSHQQGRLDHAEAGYRKHLQTAPEDHRALYLLSMLLKQRGQRDEPVNLINRAITLAPDQASYMLALAGMQMESGHIAAAQSSLAATIKLNPNAVQAYVLLARIARRAGDSAEAAKQINLALRCDPEFPEALLLAGNLALERGEAEEAVRVLAALAQKRPQDASVQACLGQAFLAQGMFAFAEQSLRNAVKLAPDFVSARVALGDALLRQGQVIEARELLAGALAEDPSSQVSRLLLGDACRASGDFAAALDAYAPLSEALAAHPPFATAYADALMNTGRIGEAVSQLDKVLAEQPTYAPAWRARLQAARVGGDSNAVEAVIDRWREAIPDDPGVVEALALLREGSAPEDAEQLADQAILADPDALAAHLIKARALLRRGDAAAAVAVLDAAATRAIEPAAQANLQRTLGAARHALGEHGRAVDHWRNAQRLFNLAPDLPPLSDARRLPAHAPLTQQLEENALRPLFLVAPPGAGGEPAAALLQDLGLRVLSDRFFAPPRRQDAFSDHDLKTWHPDPDEERVQEFRTRYRAGLEQVGIDGSEPFVDWLPSFDAGSLPLLTRAFPGARLLVAQRDRCDALLHWLAVGTPQRASLDAIEPAALWLSAAFDHAEHAAQAPIAQVLAVDAIVTPADVPPALLSLAGLDAAPALERFTRARAQPGGVPLELKPGDWERYAELLAAPFDAVRAPA